MAAKRALLVTTLALALASSSSSAADAPNVVAGLVDHAGDAVDDLVSTLMEDIGGSRDNTVTATTTTSPSPQATLTPTTTPTAALAPPASTTAPPTPSTGVPTYVPSTSGSTVEAGVDSSADGSSDGGPELEDSVLPATPSKVPTKESLSVPATTPPAAAAADTPTPTTTPLNEENVVPPVTPAPEVTPTVTPATAATPAPVTTVNPSAKSSSAPAVATDKSGVGQVHAPTYTGSLAKAVSGVGKNASEPETPQPTKKQSKKQQASDSDAADGQTVDTSNASSGNMYDMGTSSILSIVGVIVGICAIVGLFVVINRKNYGADSSDDELPMAYGYRIDGGSVVRLSPTFLHNSDSSMVGSRVGANNADQERTSSSGESGEEKMPYFGNSFGFDNYLAQSHMMKSHLMASGSGGSAGARGSALLPSDLKLSIFSSEASAESESWSSVMESEQDTMSRCTRDTSLSALTMPKQSEWDSSSRMTFGEDTSSNYRSTRASSARDTVRADSVAYSSASMAESSVSRFYSDARSTNDGGRSTSYSEFTRSTGAGSSIYSVSSP